MASSPYDGLISSERLRPSTKPGRELDVEVLSDKARIVTSTSFRRLQTKAQVFSLERNAAVRSRLTHTLEVATYGQWLAQNVFELLREKGLMSEAVRFPFLVTIENACLLHDIGNPPFGHLGEYAIRDWFANRKKEIVDAWRFRGVTRRMIDNHFLAFEHFDGNPQGLRIMTKLQWLKDEFGLNLTCTLLASIIKYLGISPQDGSPLTKKAGFFETERHFIVRIWQALGLKLNRNTPAQRHPFAFLMEAADDIAYCVSDIEDALEKRIVTENVFFEKLPPELQRFVPDLGGKYNSFNICKDAKFIIFKTGLIGYFSSVAAQAYVDHHEAIVKGDFAESLLKTDSTARVALKYLKDFTKQYIFSSREAIDVEMSGFRIVQDMLDSLAPLMLAKHEDFMKLRPDVETEDLQPFEMPIEKRLFTLLPTKHYACYKFFSDSEPELEPIYRAHLVVDYISGMTDSHAVKVFNMLKGTGAGTTL